MTKTKAKTVTCFLLGAEGVGVLAAFVVSVLTIAEWGGASISGYGKWIVCNGFYLLSAMALFYGFVFRPIRRKAVETFSSVIHFGRWTFYAEGAAVLTFALCGYLHWFWLSMPALAVYSGWKLIEIAGGLPSDSAKVILGGLMMGKAVSNLDAPIPKGCSGILILNEAHAHRSETSSCIRCGKCVSACPMGLEPYLLAKLSENHLFERAEKELITACLECGCCAYSCPSNRPILDYIRIGKNAVNQIIRSRKQS